MIFGREIHMYTAAAVIGGGCGIVLYKYVWPHAVTWLRNDDQDIRDPVHTTILEDLQDLNRFFESCAKNKCKCERDHNELVKINKTTDIFSNKINDYRTNKDYILKIKCQDGILYHEKKAFYRISIFYINLCDDSNQLIDKIIVPFLVEDMENMLLMIDHLIYEYFIIDEKIDNKGKWFVKTKRIDYIKMMFFLDLKIQKRLLDYILYDDLSNEEFASYGEKNTYTDLKFILSLANDLDQRNGK